MTVWFVLLFGCVECCNGCFGCAFVMLVLIGAWFCFVTWLVLLRVLLWLVCVWVPVVVIVVIYFVDLGC